MGEIILNKKNEIVSNYNGISYMLVKSFINADKNITLTEIFLLSSSLYTFSEKINWGVLWENKIDYLEELISENGLKYPIIVDSFNYFVGMTENAISYFNSIEIPVDYPYVINHKVIKYDDKIDVLYDPINIIFDYKVRDVAEYIKNSFFNKNRNIFNELSMYLKCSNLSLVEVKLLISRLLYPSFYFEMYEDILINSKEEKVILNIISCLDEYEEYLDNTISFLKKYFNMYENIDEILWLKKRRP